MSEGAGGRGGCEAGLGLRVSCWDTRKVGGGLHFQPMCGAHMGPVTSTALSTVL